MNGDNFYAVNEEELEEIVDESRKTQGIRYNTGKLPFELIPPEVEVALVKVLKMGAEKYAPRNWEKGLSWTETYGSLRRHLNKWMGGEDVDEESGMPHLYHVLANAAFLVTFHDRGTGTDDRPN